MTTRNFKPTVPVHRRVGFWLAAAIGAFQAINALRAAADPAAFASYMGLPIGDATGTGFVYVYALRTAFVALIVAVFLALRRLDVLCWMALTALILPIGDALLSFQAGAPVSTVARHLAIAAYLLVSFMFLRRAVADDRSVVQ